MIEAVHAPACRNPHISMHRDLVQILCITKIAAKELTPCITAASSETSGISFERGDA